MIVAATLCYPPRMSRSIVTNERMTDLLSRLRGSADPPPDLEADLSAAFRTHAILASALASPEVGVPRRTLAAGGGRAWGEFAANLANWDTRADPLTLQARERELVVGWHFPEVPRALASLRDLHALLIVSQDAPWLSSLARAGSTANFQTSAGSRAIAAALGAGRVIAAILDHVHPGTDRIPITLCGRRTAMASSLLAGALDRSYSVAVLGPRGGHVTVVDRFETQGLTATTAAARIARVLDAEVRRAPARWLMWPSLAGAPRLARTPGGTA